MKKQVPSIYLVILVLCLFNREVFAQAPKKKTRKKVFSKNNNLYPNQKNTAHFISFITGLGWSSYFGELCETGDCYRTSIPLPQLGLNYRFTKHFSLQAMASWYEIYGSDAQFGSLENYRRNLSFVSRNFEATFISQWDLIGKNKAMQHYTERSHWGMFVNLGIGVSTVNPMAELDGTLYDLRPLKTEGVEYDWYTLVVPFGLGVRYSIGRFSDLVLDIGLRYTTTDYLDDVSGYYHPNPEQLSEVGFLLGDRSINDREKYPSPTQAGVEQSAYDGPTRGNPSNNDSYYLLSFRYQWTFDKSDPIISKIYKQRKPKGR